MNQQTTESTQHFYLKPFTADHLAQVAEWYENIDDLSMIESKVPVPVNVQSLEKAWHHNLSQTEPQTSYIFFIVSKSSEPIGYVGLQDINYAHGNSVVFIYVRKDKRYCGIGLRSVALMLDLAYDQLRLHRGTTYVYTHNTPSVALLQRCGFIDEGRMREACFVDGKHNDVRIVGILAKEWHALRESLSDSLSRQMIVSIGNNVDNRWNWPSV